MGHPGSAEKAPFLLQGSKQLLLDKQILSPLAPVEKMISYGTIGKRGYKVQLEGGYKVQLERGFKVQLEGS